MAKFLSRPKLPVIPVFQPAPPEQRKVKLSVLNRKKPEWADKNQVWIDLEILYHGGYLVKQNAQRFLRRRPKEDSNVYSCRVDQVTYNNLLGTGLGWYSSELFETDPEINIRRENDQGPGDLLTSDEGFWWNHIFFKNCDGNNTPFDNFWREMMTKMLVYGETWVLVDLPKLRADQPEPRSLEEQRRMGLLDPHLILYTPVQVTNYEEDEKGEMNWCVIQVSREEQRFLEPPMLVDRWYYFDRTHFRVYEWKRDKKQQAPVDVQQTPPGVQYLSVNKLNQQLAADEDPEVDLIDEGLHCLAEYGRLPIRRYILPDNLWLANRAYLPLMDYFNADNTLSWALFMANLAMPVIIGDVDLTNQVLTETGFIQLPEGCSYKWTEPEGKSFDISAKRVASLREEIYRAMYLNGIGRQESKSAGAMSGFSKQMDFSAASDILDAIGVVVIQGMQNMLADVADAKGDEGLVFDVRGFHFEPGIDLNMIETMEKALNMLIPSELFEKEIYRIIARKFLKDANPELFEQIMEEIRNGPTRQEREMQMLAFESMLNMKVQTYDKVQGNRGSVMAYTSGTPLPPGANKILESMKPAPGPGSSAGGQSNKGSKPSGGSTYQKAAGSARNNAGAKAKPTTRPSGRAN